MNRSPGDSAKMAPVSGKPSVGAELGPITDAPFPRRGEQTPLRAPTEPSHIWDCSACDFETNSITLAVEHCVQASRDYPAHEHTLHELGPDAHSRTDARRVVYCRDRFGYCQQARVTWSRGHQIGVVK